jgi:hypothetical protein
MIVRNVWTRRFKRILGLYNRQSQSILIDARQSVDGQFPELVELLEKLNRRARRRAIHHKKKKLGIRELKALYKFVREKPSNTTVHSD